MTLTLRPRWSLVPALAAVLSLGACSEMPTSPTPFPATFPPKAASVVKGAVGITQTGEASEVSYTFAVTLTESKGVAATISALWINFDNGSGGSCMWLADKLPVTRVSANSTLVLDPLGCDNFHDFAFNVTVYVKLQDDNGHTLQVSMQKALE